MTYLLSQILLCLALAALLGGALGWLALRVRTGAALDTLRGELARRTRALTEAQGDVQMLGDDFEELRTRSRDEIDALRAENAELPLLTANLEKSQSMVRQLMQRHDAQLRELNARNEELVEQLTMMRAQADLRERAHAELEAARLEAARPPGSDGHEGDAPDGPSEASAPAPARQAPIPPAPTPSAPAASALGVPLTEPSTEPPTEPPSPSRRGWASRPLGGTGGANGRAYGGPDADTDADTDVDADGGEALDEVMEVDVFEEDDFEEDDEANATLAIDILPADVELAFDLDDRDAPLFDPVDRQDDLQRLFGIGPITEKALNTLGITSYSQLAELERHEIEKIADALQIGPERIEKDDWVGNARRQLEEVLEQL